MRNTSCGIPRRCSRHERQGHEPRDAHVHGVALFGFGIIPGMGVSQPCVYVIELNDAVRNDKKFVTKNPEMRSDKVCVYVGSTGRDPDIRFVQHLEGYKSCRYVKKCGERLRPDLVPRYENGFKNSREAEAAEATLAVQLRKRGHGVWQN